MKFEVEGIRGRIIPLYCPPKDVASDPGLINQRCAQVAPQNDATGIHRRATSQETDHQANGWRFGHGHAVIIRLFEANDKPAFDAVESKYPQT
jgi:hypothetical protein